MSTYTTIQGDKWDQIAHRELGSVRHTGALMRANCKYLDYYTFPAGIVLTLPEVTASEADDAGLPPWKRPGQIRR